MENLNLIEIESLVDDTQLSAEAVCACNVPTGMCSCIGCTVPTLPGDEIRDAGSIG